MPDGSHPFGSSGLDFTNHRLNGAATYYDQPDPALLPYGRFEAISSGGDGGQTVYRFIPNENSGITDQGYVRGPHGENLAQLQDPTGGGRLLDPNAVTDDPRYGLLTNVDNFRPSNDLYDRFFAPLVFAALGGAAFSGIGGGVAGETADTVAGTDAAESAGTLAVNAAGTGVTPYVPSALSGGDIAPGLLQNIPTPEINPLSTGPNIGTSSSFLSTLNTARHGLSLANLANRLLGGNSTGTRNTTRKNHMPGSNGDDNSLGGLGGLLSLLGLGRSTFGNGVGTSRGAVEAGNRAADRADPWGANGHREGFSNLLTPEYVQSLLNPDPNAIKSDPAYQFQLEQGTNAINVGDAAQGSLHSGNRMYELEKYGQGLASDFTQRQFTQNLQRLGLLGKFGGVDSSNPSEAGRDIISGFVGGTNLQNNGLNGLLSQLLGGKGGGGLLSLLSGGLSGIGGLLGGLFGGGDSSDFDWESILSGTGGGDVSDSLFGGLGDVFGAGP